ncbi:MAG: hypothetical protein PWQ06_843 [Anaerophaga sp.]|nr:hypothetical protein [Anaerophaga sp.]
MKNTTILFLSKFFEKGSLFLFFIFFGRYLGKEAFGEYSYFFSIASFLFVLMDIGGEFYQIKLFAKDRTINTLFNIGVIKSVISVLILIPIGLFNEYFLCLLVMSFWAESLISVFRSTFYFQKKFFFAAGFNIIEKLIFVALFIFNSFAIESLLFMYATLSISKIMHILLIAYIKKDSITLKEININFSFWKEYLRESWSYVLHSALVIFFGQLSIILLKKFEVSYGSIATYSVAIKIVMAIVTLFPDILFRQYYPTITRMIYIQQEESLTKYLSRIRKANVVLALILIGVLFLSANELIKYTFGNEFSDAVLLLVFLSPVLIFRFSMYPYSGILSGSDFNYLKIIASGSCTIINLTLNFILIPKYGIWGAGIAFVVTELSLFVIYKLASMKVLKLSYFPKSEIIGIVISFFPWIMLSVYEKISMGVRLWLLIIIGMTVLFFRKRFLGLFNFDHNLYNDGRI